VKIVGVVQAIGRFRIYRIRYKCVTVNSSEEDIDDYVFGYTCVNDATAPKELKENDEFHQRCRSKSLPGFGPLNNRYLG
jgi:2-keto-4-pentenoate hydratase/2-oxohepta-3-ene-1,7-dioic acid hydratase in catechol pathway